MVFVGDALQLPTDDAVSWPAKRRTTLLGQGQLSSPSLFSITYDQYDICSMAKDGSLASKHLSETGIRGVTKAHLP